MEYKYTIERHKISYNSPYFFGEDIDPVYIVISKDASGEEKISAFSANCPHKGAHLGEGIFVTSDSSVHVQCRWHGCEFDLKTGYSVTSKNRLVSREVKVDNELIYVR